MRKPRRIALLIIASCLAIPASSQARDVEGSQPIVALALSTDSGQKTIRIAVESGERASIALPDGKSRLELLPTVVARESETVGVELFEVVETATGESSRRVEEFSLRKGEPYQARFRPQLSVVLEEVRSPRPTVQPPMEVKPGTAIVTVSLKRPSMATATAKVREGEVLRVASVGNGIAIRPRLLRGERVEFQVFQLPLESQLDERSRPFERFILMKDAEYISSTSPFFALTLRDVKPFP